MCGREPMDQSAGQGHDGPMPTIPEDILCEYVTDAGRHELVAVLDELSLTYRILIRSPDGTTRIVRELIPSRRNARRWALHYRHKALLEASDPPCDRSVAAAQRRSGTA